MVMPFHFLLSPSRSLFLSFLVSLSLSLVPSPPVMPEAISVLLVVCHKSRSSEIPQKHINLTVVTASTVPYCKRCHSPLWLLEDRRSAFNTITGAGFKDALLLFRGWGVVDQALSVGGDGGTDSCPFFKQHSEPQG